MRNILNLLKTRIIQEIKSIINLLEKNHITNQKKYLMINQLNII